MKTELTGHLRAADTAFAISFTAVLPSLPVKTLALPEFTKRACALPFCSLSLHQITGHPGTDVFVSTPATEVFDFNLTNSKSGRPLYFKPERLVELETPATPGIRGKFLGANGDFFKSITKILRNRR